MQTETENDETQTATVSEDKFNGSATLNIQVPTDTDKKTVKRIAERYFEDKHATRPSRVVAEFDESGSMFGDEDRWTVMVADHSSGSLVDGKEYEL